MNIDARIASLKHDALRRADQLIAEVQHLKAQIERGRILNGLGELQAMPAMLDCRVAALAELQALKREEDP